MTATWSTSWGLALPELRTNLPGPNSISLVDTLARHESPGITARRARQGEARGMSKDPIVWAKAAGANVWDPDDNRFVDLTAGFGVATIGHSHPRVIAAIQAQAERLLHGMGDVFPNDQRIRLMEALADIAPEGLTQCILAGGGSDAVEAALKTAAMASGKPGVLAFWGGYHGLSYGALAATAYKGDFRAPFAGQLGPHTRHLPYGCDPAWIDGLLAGPATGGEHIGAILVEPIQGRGGQVIPPPGWLAALREICTKRKVILIFDEIYTGFGRTGAWWAGEAEGVIPDVMAVGKALGGGMPVGACLARPEVMRAWGNSVGEAIHTSTFLGNPVVAAASLATLEVMKELDTPALAREFETATRAFFEPRGIAVRGRGGMLALELGSAARAGKLMGKLMNQGYLSLPNGIYGDILGLTPPLVLSEAQRSAAFHCIIDQLAEIDATV